MTPEEKATLLDAQLKKENVLPGSARAKEIDAALGTPKVHAPVRYGRSAAILLANSAKIAAAEKARSTPSILDKHLTDAQETALKNTPQGGAYARMQAETPVPGSARAREIAHTKTQQGVVDNAVDGFGDTAAATTARIVKQEAPALLGDASLGNNPDTMSISDKGSAHVAAAVMSILGYRGGKADYDKEVEYDNLTKGIPYEFHDDILENDNHDAALRARSRIVDDLARGSRMAQQDSGTLAVMAGSMFDVDLPLSFMSGGAYADAKISRLALRASRSAGVGPRLGARIAGAAQGMYEGTKSGLVVGAVSVSTSETVGWEDLVNMTFSSALLSGATGGALTGDVHRSLLKSAEEFNARVRTDDPNLTSDLNVQSMSRTSDRINAFSVADDFAPGSSPDIAAGPSTVGAVQIGAANAPTVSLVDPAGPITPTSQKIIDSTTAWRHDTDWADRKTAEAEGWFSKVVTSSAGSFTANNFISLYKSSSSVANWISGTIFESSSGLGRGRATAAVQMENYIKRIQGHIAASIEPYLMQYAKDVGGTWLGTGFGSDNATRMKFNREVMLDINDRALGRQSPKRHASVTKAADQYERAGTEALDVGRGRAGELAMDGFDNIKDRRGYTPYWWSGRQILALEKAGIVTRADIVDALADGYIRAGMGTGKDAQAVAKAVLHRAVARETDVDTSLISMLSGDGKEWLAESLRISGMSGPDADALMGRLIGKQMEAGKEGFAKMRNEIDMSAPIRTSDGSTVQVVDLLDNDMHGIWQRYSRRIAGSAALARQGITNRAQRREVIAAMQAEQRALGEEPINGDLMEAMFSHFNGGPVWGHSREHTNQGVGLEIAVAKRMTNISLLEKLGVTQLAETGVTIAQNGFMNWMQRGPMALFNKELKARNTDLLADMAYFTGHIGDDHTHFATWLDLDDVSTRDRTDWLQKASKLSSNAQWLQGYTSGFNHVRTFQQTTAALGMADKVMRTLKENLDAGTDLSPAMRKRFEGDFGLFAEDIRAIENLIENGTVEFITSGGNTFVDRLNMSKWGTDIGEVFGVSITRNINQLVQKSMAGEQDAWMHTQWGSVLTHLKSFPLQAVQKQVLRNARHVDVQGVMTLMMGMATAGVTVAIKDAIDGKDRTASELAMQAFNYSNMTGFIPMVTDPVMTMLGLEDMRFNSYGPYTDLTPPMFKVANDARRIPGALWDTAVGTADYYDRQALKALPFAGTYGISRAFD